jgi:hypothetical protein
VKPPFRVEEGGREGGYGPGTRGGVSRRGCEGWVGFGFMIITAVLGRSTNCVMFSRMKYLRRHEVPAPQ